MSGGGGLEPADRGVKVDHTTIFRWIQACAATLEKRLRPHLGTCNGSWRVTAGNLEARGPESAQQMPGPAQNMPCSASRMVRTRSEAMR